MVYRPDAGQWHALAAKMRARGETTSEIAAELGQSPAAVCNALRRLADKAKTSTAPTKNGAGFPPDAASVLSYAVAGANFHAPNVKEPPS